MKLTLQKGIDPHTNEIIWLMLDEDYQVVEPIQRYLTCLTTSKSPNTVESYAYDLKILVGLSRTQRFRLAQY